MPKVGRLQAVAVLILAVGRVLGTTGGIFPAGLAMAQQLPHLAGTPDPDNPQQDQNNEPDQSVSTLKVNVNVVQLFFNVKDKKGGLIPNLTKSDFQISEDGKPQTIKYFAAESDLPLTLGILIDSSGSQRHVLEMEKEVCANFLKNPASQGPGVRHQLRCRFQPLAGFHQLDAPLAGALNRARINAPPSSCGGPPGQGGGPLPCGVRRKGTVLYDTIYLAAHDNWPKKSDARR